MRERSRGWAWGVIGLVGCFVACSSSGVVLETRRGDPSPHDGDAGAVSTGEDAGPPKGVDPDLLRSGSRIHVQVHVADGDFIGVQGLHDTLKDVDCYIQLADDGVSRCLPGGTSPAVTSLVYTDAGCTQPLLRVEPGSAPCYGPPVPPPYVVSSTPSSCNKSPKSSIFTPGAQVDPPAQLYDTANATGTCQPSTVALVGSSGVAASIYALNPSPASDWVAFQKTTKPLTSRLGIVQWSGSDGTLTVGDTVLLSNDAPCSPFVGRSVPEPAAVTTCIPSNIQYITNGEYFSDSTCTAGVAVVPDCQAPELLFEWASITDSCGNGTPSYFLPGEILSSTVYTTLPPSPQSQSTSCSPAGKEVKAYAKGAPVDPSSYPPMQMVLTGTGRVRHYEWQSEGVSISSTSNWVDAATGASVTAQSFADGVTLGAFSTTTTDKFFSDPGCKTWLLDEYSDDYTSQNLCTTPPTARWVAFAALPTPATLCDQQNGSTYQSSVRPVLGKHTGKVYTLDPDINLEMNGACSEYVPSKTKSNGIYDFYDLGNPIPARSLFAEIKTVDL
jgi:hypothetical protein